MGRATLVERPFSIKTIMKTNLLIAGSVLVIGFGVYGWGSNIYKLATGSCGTGLNSCVVVRAVGIPVTPLGSVLGYFNF